MATAKHSETFWIGVLLTIMCIFSVSKPSNEPSYETTSFEYNSELHYDSVVDNQTSQEFYWSSVYDTAYNTSATIPEMEDQLFRWNASIMTAEVFQSTFCSKQCRGGELVFTRLNDQCSNVQCFPCNCDKPLCEMYGTCCPDHDMQSADCGTDFDEASSSTDKQCIHSNDNGSDTHVSKDTGEDLVCGGNGNHGYLSKRSCPMSFPDDEVRSKCQDDISTAEQDIDTFLLVSDNGNGMIYYNEKCAACNNVTQVTPLTLLVECHNYMTVYTSRTPRELLRLGLASPSDCRTRSKPSRLRDANGCHESWFNGTVVDTCNVTGKWDAYDSNVVKACAGISGLVNRVRVGSSDSGILYKNLFCAMCNMNTSDLETACESKDINRGDTDHRFQRRLPFSVLLNFGPQGRLMLKKNVAANCSQDYNWKSPDNQCMPLQCSPGKILTSGRCSTALRQIRGLVYQFHIYYLLNDLIEITNYTESAYLLSFEKHISWATLNSGVQFLINVALVYSENIVLFRENHAGLSVNTSREFHLDFLRADGFILGDYLYSRDEVEANMLMDFILNNVTLDIDANTTVTLLPTLHPHRKQQLINCSALDSEISSCISRNLTSDNFYRVSEKDKQGALTLEPHLNCAFVQFNKTEYLYIKNITTKPESCSITLNLKNARMTLTDRADLNMVSIDDDGTMRICLELLNTKEFIKSVIISSHFLNLTLYALSLICMISSIICLAITLMTYFLFPVLRSVAGKNNIFLCGSLLLAQISLLATSHVQETGHLCTIVAICTHFLWLSMFCWCFTCCFHMFCVFSAKTRSIQSSAKSDMVYMIKRVVACSVIPGLIVTGVIATNLTISGREFLGYGQTACFVDSQITLIIALVAPLCLVLLFNFTFFSITVIKIYQVRKLQTREFRKDDHNNLYIYIKLSSMTGIFWVLSVISEATDNDPLRFISIGLNGLQGVFIFLSYICNRRVLKLYLKLLGLETYFPTTSTSDRSTIAQVVTDVDKHDHRPDDTETIE